MRINVLTLAFAMIIVLAVVHSAVSKVNEGQYSKGDFTPAGYNHHSGGTVSGLLRRNLGSNYPQFSRQRAGNTVSRTQ